MFETTKKSTFTRKIVNTIFIVFSILITARGSNKMENMLIYILIWTPTVYGPFDAFSMGQKSFENCTFNNCFFTVNRSYLNNIMDFDVIMFNIWQISVEHLTNETDGVDLPFNRSETQKYCLVAIEPAAYHPIFESWNGFFNISFTFKLTSNVSIPYVVVRDQNDVVIGPKVDMHWMQLSEMNETSDYVKNKLQNKHIAVAWIVSHCDTPWRVFYAQHLEKELAHYGHQLHIFGKCGAFPCSHERKMEECFASIESDYYFYLSFENSFGEDYVTEKILNALQHFSVPVVFGSANYSRFMPEGIYLDANALAPYQMAERMNEIINDNSKYYEFFKWHDYYSFHLSSEERYSAAVCSLCAYLNKSKNITSILDNIAFWWNVEWPPWPEEIDEPNETEQIVRNFLNVLDPSSDD